MEISGCNLLVCGHLDDLEADDCCEDDVLPENTPADDCCPDDPENSDEHSEDNCLCCNAESDVAVTGRDDVLSVASDLVIIVVPAADRQGAISMPDVLPVRTGVHRGVGPPRTLHWQRTLLQI